MPICWSAAKGCRAGLRLKPDSGIGAPDCGRPGGAAHFQPPTDRPSRRKTSRWTANASSSVVGATSSGRPVSFCPVLRALASISAARAILSGAFIATVSFHQIPFQTSMRGSAGRAPAAPSCKTSVMNGTRRMLRRTMLAALCALPALLPGGSAQAKDDLVIGVSQFPSSLHPDIDPEVIKAYVLDFATRPLTSFDKDWKLVCLLCTELPTIENGLAKFEDRPDGSRGMAVTFKLKPDLAWGDGVPVTAKDIAFTWKAEKDPASGIANPHSWNQVAAVDVVDDHTAVLHLDKVDYQYNQWGDILPAHIEQAAYDKAAGPGDYGKQTVYNRAPTTPGLYNGPFIVTGYQSGSQIVLEPNPHWAGPKPGLKRIVIRAIENTAALQANLLSGDVDMIGGEGVGLTIDQVLALRKQHPDQFDYIFKPSLNYEHIDLRGDNPIFSDVRVRKAFLLAIDRKTLNDKLFEGLQPVAATWVNPLEQNYAPDVPHYGYDPKQAK